MNEHQRFAQHVDVEPTQPDNGDILSYENGNRRWTFAYNIIQIATDLAQVIADLAAHIADINNPHVSMKWRGLYTQGNTYNEGDVALDDVWLGYANKTTQDPIAPAKIGDPSWATEFVGTPAFSEQTVSQSFLVTGQRYIPSNSFQVTRLRVSIPEENVGMTAEIWLVTDPLGVPNYIQLVAGFTVQLADTEQWFELPIGERITPQGVAFDVVLAITPTVGEQSFVAEWDYKRNDGNPSSGEAWHQSGGNQDTLRFHQVDKDDTNQDTNLANIGPGSTIAMASSGYVWTVLEATKITGTVYEFIVDPASRAGEDTSNFTFTYYVLSSMNYEVDTNFWQGDSEVSGFVGDAYDPDGMTLDDHAYGVDIYVQQIDFSDDWDLLAFSG